MNLVMMLVLPTDWSPRKTYVYLMSGWTIVTHTIQASSSSHQLVLGHRRHPSHGVLLLALHPLLYALDDTTLARSLIGAK